ncbi:hypothetical protein P7C73_g1895, partial [Tremellales sp. Uapishka_1]
MPSLLTPALQVSGSSSKTYAPLADEVNPPFGNIAPEPTVRNGNVVYAKRVSSYSSASEGDRLRSESEETLGPLSSPKGKERAIQDDDAGDIGEMRRVAKGKGKEKQWDPERGGAHEEEEEEEEAVGYPPVNGEHEDEKRIQDNLASFAARDMARRKAARLSKQLPASPRPSSSRPRSVLSDTLAPGLAKRTSLMGMVGGIWGTRKNEGWGDGELPLSTSPRMHQQAYTNPYDTQPAFSPAPRMSPSSPLGPSPFADPTPPAPSVQRSTSPLESPDAQGYTYGYAGPTWRGGEAAGNRPPAGGEKWWHALCVWGEDEETGPDGQAGRTNPFE